ncbi:hypothetical protein HY488_00175 [Candidatus Woesearchaeota archaeon]|nr:hypothetical protein [Candidatus Woesearchaeota archaeon]
MTNLLILGKGDTPYSDRNPQRLFEHAQRAGFAVQRYDYHKISTLHDFKGERINIMFFFPYTFWNANCETPKDTGLYGTSAHAYRLLKNFFLNIRDEITHHFLGREVHFVIPPEYAALDRDKIETIEQLQRSGVPTTERIHYHCLQDVLEQITPERGIFIKCRYGAEGKGITLLRDGQWRTNYRIDGNLLANYGVYDRWPFTDITGRQALVKQLMENEVIVEREVLAPDLFHGKKFDARAYVVGKEAPHMFVRINDHEKVVTNFSQGAEVRHHPMTNLPQPYLEVLVTQGVKAAHAMHSQFMGVDMMFDGDETQGRVVEVQTFTDFPHIERFNLAEYLVHNKGNWFV